MEYNNDNVLKPYRLDDETYEEYQIRRRNNKKLLKLHKQKGYKKRKE